MLAIDRTSRIKEPEFGIRKRASSKLKIITNSETCPMFSLDALFGDVDDFCQSFEPRWKTRLLHHGGVKRIRAKSL